MLSRDLAYLEPVVLGRYSNLFGICEARKLRIVVTRTACTWDVQTAIVAQGRVVLAKVNQYRVLAGLGPLPSTHPNNIVSWTTHSDHILPLDPKKPQKVVAFDLVLIGPDGRASYDIKADVNKNNEKDYNEIGKIWTDLDPKCKWGGVYGDYCHFYYRG